MTEERVRRPLIVRALAAALDHSRRGPLTLRERIVYVRSLMSPVDQVPARVEATFAFDPPLVDGGVGGLATEPPIIDHFFRALVDGREAYRMRVSLDGASTARLVPETDVPPRVVFFYDCFTHADSRGQGLYPASLTSAMRMLADLRYERAYIRVHRGNQASIAGIEKAGFTRCGRIVHAAVFGFPLGPWKRPESGSGRDERERT